MSKELLNQIYTSSFAEKWNAVNTLGYEEAITTLTGIKQRVTQQKFYEIPIAEYLPVVVGENAWAEDILTWLNRSIADDFESGNIDTGYGNARLTNVESALESKSVPVITWAREMDYTLADVEKATRAGASGWNKITSLEEARKKSWDLGIQRIAFLGSEQNSGVKGLLTQDDVTSNTSTITESIKGMTTSEFQTLIENLLGDYFANSNNTAYPDTFVIPQDDYNGLGAAADETFNIKSKLQRLRESFVEITGNPNFKILPLVYSQQSFNQNVLGSGSGLNRYVLYRQDPESGRMDIPVDYTTTNINTNNGFFWKSVAYGQYTGYKQYRENEMLYFDYT